MSARKSALSVLCAVTRDGAYAGIALDKEFKNTHLDTRDRALASKIVYGVIQNLSFIDYQIEGSSQIKLSKLSPVIHNILRMSVYQLFFLDKVPDSAVVNEAVELSKKMKLAKASGFVNAVLRNIIRKGKILPEKTDIIKYYSILYSYPEWMVNLWAESFGYDECEKLLAAGNEDAPLTVRVNRTKTTVDDFLSVVSGKKTSAPQGVELFEKGDITKVYGYSEGLFTVQDTASQMVAHLLSPKEGERVLDTCSAPGGKTTHIAELMNDKGEVIAWDLYKHKVKLVQSALERLGLCSVKVSRHNAEEPVEPFYEKFDKVLVDAPCSGLGIIRKKPDIKWSRQESDIDTLAAEQLKLLRVSSQYVKPGGTLVYSTCTICDTENDGTVSKFLEDNKNFYIDKKVTLYPHIHKTDGFFMCRMIKRG